MKIILVDPNLVRTFFGNNFFDPDYGGHPWKYILNENNYGIKFYTFLFTYHGFLKVLLLVLLLLLFYFAVVVIVINIIIIIIIIIVST